MSAAPPRFVALADAPVRPWRNGGGRTRELLAWPDAADWRLRISLADIGRDGPFSRFPGVRRWFAVVAGAGVELELDGTAWRLAPDRPAVAFDGALAPACRLIDGPTQDLNLMLRGGGRGAIKAARGNLAWRPGATAAGVFSLDAATVQAGGDRHALPAAGLLWFGSAPAELAVGPAAGGDAGQPRAWFIAASPEEAP